METKNRAGAVYMAFIGIHIEVARLCPPVMIVALLSCSRNMLHAME